MINYSKQYVYTKFDDMYYVSEFFDEESDEYNVDLYLPNGDVIEHSTTPTKAGWEIIPKKIFSQIKKNWKLHQKHLDSTFHPDKYIQEDLRNQIKSDRFLKTKQILLKMEKQNDTND